MEVTPQARMPHEVFYVLYFFTSSTVQHPSWRVAQGLFAHPYNLIIKNKL